MKIIENSKGCLKRAAKWYFTKSAESYTYEGYNPMD